MDKVTREIRVDLTPAEIEARRQSLAENGLQLVSWEANRKAVLAPIDAEGKHLKETRKDLAEAIETRKELRSVECAWYEEGTQRYLRRLDNGETIDQEPLRPEEILKTRQTSLPLEEPPPAPEAPAPTREPLQLPEHAGPGLTDEAEVHEGGPLAPEAPTVHRALPAARHADAIEADIVAEAEPTEGNLQRAVLLVLGRGATGHWWTMPLLLQVVGQALPGLRVEEAAVRACLEALTKAKRVEAVTETFGLKDSWRLIPEAPEAPKAKGSKAPAKKAPAKGKARGRQAQPARALGDVIDGVLRKLRGWLIEEQLLASVREEMPLDAQPSDRDWRGVVDTMLAQKRIERREEGGRVLYRTNPASLEAGRALDKEEGEIPYCAQPGSPMRARVVRALEDAHKPRSARAISTALHEDEDTVRLVLVQLEQEKLVTGWNTSHKAGRAFELVTKAESRPSKGKAPAPKAAKPAFFNPSKKPGYLIPTLTSAGARAVVSLLREAPNRRMPKEEITRLLNVPEPCAMPSQCYYQSGDWVLKEEHCPSKPAPPAPPAPPPCPPPPATGHPQRVLRGWIYDRIMHTGELPLEVLQAESPRYHQEYIEGTISLLLGCECLMVSGGVLRALELPSAPSASAAVLDAVAGALLDAPLASATIAGALETPHVIIFDVLQELRDAGRVALRGDAWHLTHGASEAEEAA